MNMGDQSEGNSWGAGDGVWKLVAFIGSFALHLKGFLTAAVTLDRFTAVVRPLMQGHSKSQEIIIGCVGWKYYMQDYRSLRKTFINIRVVL